MFLQDEDRKSPATNSNLSIFCDSYNLSFFLFQLVANGWHCGNKDARVIAEKYKLSRNLNSYMLGKPNLLRDKRKIRKNMFVHWNPDWDY